MELYFARRHVCHRNQMRRFSCDTLLRCTLNRHFWCCQTFSSHTFPSVVELTGSTCSLWQPTFSTFSRALNFLCCPAALGSCRVSWFGFLWWSDFLRWERNIAEQCTSPGLQHPLFRLQSRCSSRKSFNYSFNGVESMLSYSEKEAIVYYSPFPSPRCVVWLWDSPENTTLHFEAAF